MSRFEVIMPKMGESVAEATIIKWVKNIGDKIDVDETIVEIATDKVDSEIPSENKGILKEKLYQENEVVKVGDVIAIIEDGNLDNTIGTIVNEDSPIKENLELPTKENLELPTKENLELPIEKNLELPIKETEGERFWREIQEQDKNIPHQENITKDKQINSTLFLSPLVKSIVKKENISFSEIKSIHGTGQNGRITKNDVLTYIKNRFKQKDLIQEKRIEKQDNSKIQKSAVFNSGEVEILEMDRMRKIIAEHMIKSKSTSAHVTSFVEADVSRIVEWRDRIKNKFLERENQKITYTPIIFESIIKSILDFPLINISVDGDKIIKHKNINLGMATALPSGNLIVPVIQNAQEKNILGLTKNVNDLANRARNNQLKPDEISGGTFTVTNVGSFGSIMGTPIINQPQVAILALGKIQKKPTVIETEFGDTIGIRSKMFLSLSYDHRVVDGALGGSFLKRIADYLEAFDTSREI